MDKCKVVKLDEYGRVMGKIMEPYKVERTNMIHRMELTILDVETMNKVEIKSVATMKQLKRLLDDYLELYSEMK